MCVGGVAHAQVIGSTCGIRVYHAHKAMCVAASSRFWWWLRRILVKGFVVAGVGRVFQWVECPSCREVCQAWYREYVRSLVDGLSFVQVAHVVGVSKRTGGVWRRVSEALCMEGVGSFVYEVQSSITKESAQQ